MVEIKHKSSLNVIYTSNKKTIKEAIIEAYSKKVSLRNADLRGADLEGANLEGIILEGANLEGASLRGVCLRVANLNGANLRGANLEGTYLSGADLKDADFEGINLVGSALEEAKLGKARNIKSFQCGESNRVSFAVKWGDYVMFKIGCFWGNAEEAIEKTRKKYGVNSDYEKLINLYTNMFNNERKLKMETDKTKLLQDIKILIEELASMVKEPNKAEEVKHFPSKGEKYYSYYPNGDIGVFTSVTDGIIPNAYKTHKEAKEAYDKAVALEIAKRSVIELQSDLKPN